MPVLRQEQGSDIAAPDLGALCRGWPDHVAAWPARAVRRDRTASLMADVVWSCPDCDGDLDDDFWCGNCQQQVSFSLVSTWNDDERIV
jgi:hypothetical protein